MNAPTPLAHACRQPLMLGSSCQFRTAAGHHRQHHATPIGGRLQRPTDARAETWGSTWPSGWRSGLAQTATAGNAVSKILSRPTANCRHCSSHRADHTHFDRARPLWLASAASGEDGGDAGPYDRRTLGLNLVTGFRSHEMGMFGLDSIPHDDRYVMAAEFTDLMQTLWREGGTPRP